MKGINKVTKVEPTMEIVMSDLRPFKSDREDVNKMAIAKAPVVSDIERLAIAGVMS